MATDKLSGFQKRYLRGMAHGLKPVMHVGRKGVTDTFVKSMDDALESHEIVKLKFIDFKNRDQKRAMISVIEKSNRCELVGMVGHMAIFFRRNMDPEKRAVNLPENR